MQNFEEALKELEEITKALEDDALSLEQSLKLYESGVKKAALLQKLLEEAKQTVISVEEEGLSERKED